MKTLRGILHGHGITVYGGIEDSEVLTLYLDPKKPEQIRDLYNALRDYLTEYNDSLKLFRR